MTNNLDEFDQEELEPMAGSGAKKNDGLGANLKDAWQTRPLFKLVIIMLAVGVAIAVSLSFAGGPAPDVSKIVRAPDLNEAPGSKASPFFRDQNEKASNMRAEQAMQQGGSAIPTPVGQSVDLEPDKKNDPLVEFRAETERLKQELRQEQQQNAQQIQQIQQQQVVQQQQPQQQAFDESLAQAMQRQMQTLSESWQPRKIGIVNGVEKGTAGVSSPAVKVASMQTESVAGSAAANGGLANGQNGTIGGGINGNNSASYNPQNASTLASQNDAAVNAINNDKVLVPAGTVSYSQLLTEANSDVPGTILAQIVSGPLAGGRAIGQFQVYDEYIALTFNLVNLNGKDYSVNAMALNPNTTLGGMASEVDPRYFKRVLLPAAASFMQSFGQAMGSSDTSTTVGSNVVISNQAHQGVHQGIYSGIGQAGQTISQFMNDQANKTKQLVRIAAGTPMGMFFMSTVREKAAQAAVGFGQQFQGTNNQNGYQTINGYGNMGSNNGYQNNSGPYSTKVNSSNTNSNVRIYEPSGNSYSNNGGYSNNGYYSGNTGTSYYSQ